MRTVVLLIIVLTVMSAFAFPSIYLQENRSAGGLKPFVSWSGSHSKIEKQDYFRIASQEDWIDLWLKHKGLESNGAYDTFYNPAGLPEIDFDKCMVIAVFQGKKWNSAGVIIHSMIEDENCIRCRFDDKSYQTMGPDGGGERVTPFGIFVVPASSKALVFEENIQGLKYSAPQWKEQARLDGQK